MQADMTSLDFAARWRALAHAKVGTAQFMSLKDAVAAHVRDKDVLYFGGSMARPNAAMFEVIRQFWNRTPDFTLVAPAVANQHAPMIAGGLVKRVITSIHAITYPTPAPHPLYVEAARSGRVAFENWSLLTLSHRLMAAALGLPFMPTRSLAGSDMGKSLAALNATMSVRNPFDDGNTQVVAPLSPDVTFIHGLAADDDGNILICPPLYDGVWAAFCAGRAVIATVDHIVSSEFLRRYPEHVRVPAYAVSAVCHVPLGGHPNSLPSAPVPELAGYTDDYAMLTDLRRAGKKTDTLLEWTREWILDCRDHDDYLAKLGSERIQALQGRTAIDGWRLEAVSERARLHDAAPTEAERHVVLAARMLRNRLANGDTSALLAGLGISSLAAWMVAIQLAESGKHLPLMVESGMFGYVPSPGDPFLFNYRNMAGSSMLSDTQFTLGLLTGGAQNRAFGVLGAAEVDAHGNLNSSELPGMLLTGSGGANDIGSSAREILVTIAHSPKRLVRSAGFITTPGRAVLTVVTPWAVFERPDSHSDFVLTRVQARDGLTADELAELALRECAWDVKASKALIIEPEPTDGELDLARHLDPDRLFLA
jgi:acyl CoA:acetate/3-ketoacid CoA transferase alpha subunit/acyl CoA:acetate/3-ketoacid CoA transferase beta subunit